MIKILIKKNLYNLIFPWIPVILWMFLIFSLSAQPASQSNGLSKNVTKMIIDTIGRIVPIDVETSNVTNIEAYMNHVVRKLGHFFEYFILGILVINAFNKCGHKGFKLILFSFVFCVIYASTDEIHQLFVLGRGGQIKDVFIDSIGSLFGIALYEVVYLLTHKINITSDVSKE